MTVQELIDKLTTLEEKTLPVLVFAGDAWLRIVDVTGFEDSVELETEEKE